MSKKEKQPKQPRTIKVKNLVFVIVAVASMLLAFVGGVVYERVQTDNYDKAVKKGVVVYLEDVKGIIKAVMAEESK